MGEYVSLDMGCTWEFESSLFNFIYYEYIETVAQLQESTKKVRSVVQVHSGLPNLHGKFEEVLTTCYGAIAQLGERLLCTQEVSGSIPLGSIESKDSSIVH